MFCLSPLTSGGGEPVLQRLQCCGAPVQCFTWSKDEQLLAVGGCDDNIQILQCKEPAKMAASAPRNSLLNYCALVCVCVYVCITLINAHAVKSSRLPKFLHTRILKGEVMGGGVPPTGTTPRADCFLFYPGHRSFVADAKFAVPRAGCYMLVSLGWDGQLLFWKHLLSQHFPPLQRSKSVRGDKLDVVEMVEPAGGFKLGPSSVIEFLPLSLCTLMGRGLAIAMRNKLGGTAVACYLKQ